MSEPRTTAPTQDTTESSAVAASTSPPPTSATAEAPTPQPTPASPAAAPPAPVADAAAGAPTQPQPGGGSQAGSLATRIVAIVLLVGAGAGIATYAKSGGEPAPEPGRQAAPGAMPVKVVEVRREDVPYEPTFLARSSPSEQVELRSRVSGYLRARSFAEGGAVLKGQELFQIDPRPIENALEVARARLAAAKARRDRASQQRERYRKLSAQQAATEGELEEWEKELRVAAAEVALQEAQIADAELQLDYASIAAPLAGRVGETQVDVGAYVTPETPLVTIQQVDPIYVRAAITEQDLLRLQRLGAADAVSVVELRGLELEVTLADGRRFPHRGKIDFLSPQVQTQTGTAVIRGVIPNPDHLLRPGQFVDLKVVGMRRLGVVRVPQRAVRHSSTGASVYVVGGGGTVEVRPIVLGEWLGQGQWIVESGLREGDQVIVNRLLTLRPGAPVAPTKVSVSEILTGGAAAVSSQAEGR